MHLGPFGLNRLPNLHLELFLGQRPVACPECPRSPSLVRRII
jgi:hypothetical protein